MDAISALHVAHARLSGVVGDYLYDGVILEFGRHLFQPVFLDLAFDDEVAGDVQFFLPCCNQPGE